MTRSRHAAVLATVLLATLSLATGGRAQEDPALSPLVEALEVIAKPPGPAMWRVTRGDAEVVIVGTVSPIAHQQDWDSRRVERALTGAKLLLTASKAKTGPVVLAALLLRDAPRLRVSDGSTLESRLPPQLAGRFAADRQVARQKADRYDKWKPGAAGFMLLSDYDKAAGLSRAKPAQTIERMARQAKVKTRPMNTVDLGPLIKQAGKLDDEGHRVCLEVALGELERQAPDPRAVGRAWANGDLRTLNRIYRPSALEPCLLQISSGPALIARQIDSATSGVSQALASAGRTVALIDLSLLLRPGGVLDRLAAQGDVVNAPP
jgi:uncharacterized protein YbaP (TraB family)